MAPTTTTCSATSCSTTAFLHSIPGGTPYSEVYIDTESDSEATEGGAIPVLDSVRDTEDSEGDVDEFNMLTTDMDAATERAVALAEYVLPEQDNNLKATAFRFVYIYLGGNGVKAAGNDSTIINTRLTGVLKWYQSILQATAWYQEYQHFTFHSARPGKVFVHSTLVHSTETVFNMMTTEVFFGDLRVDCGADLTDVRPWLDFALGQQHVDSPAEDIDDGSHIEHSLPLLLGLLQHTEYVCGELDGSLCYASHG
ncbi:hypothetical protein LSAT2_014185 [Lamellibrachia satsuma]|nr:hypothetical protein LSAT2_014185 [Lamellibrachia satsuma]